MNIITAENLKHATVAMKPKTDKCTHEGYLAAIPISATKYGMGCSVCDGRWIINK